MALKLLKKLHEISKTEYIKLNPTLDRIIPVLKKLGNPEEKLKNVIHISGTNGKGSVTTFISEILIRNGYKTCLYTSPHIIRYNERIRINRECITDEKTEECLEEIVKLEPDIFDKLSYFEILTVIMFKLLSETEHDFVVIEVGLGGRFDATNVIRKPKLCVVTKIHYDHTELLGKTLVSIAKEEFGIITPDSSVVCGDIPKYILDSMSSELKKKQARIYKMNKDFSFEVVGDDFIYHGLNREIRMSVPEYFPDFEFYNFAIVLAVTELIEMNKYKLNYDVIRIDEIFNSISARFQVINKDDKKIIFDVAHNPDACRALKRALKRNFNDKFSFIIGVLKDKDYEKMCEILSPVAKTVITITPNSIRSLGAKKLAEVWRRINPSIPVKASNSISDAWKLVKNEDKICITGSFYTVSEFFKLLNVRVT